MANKKRGGASYKSQYAAYKAQDRAKKNRVKRLTRHLKEHENDQSATKALERQKGHIRKKPTSKKQHVKFYGLQQVSVGDNEEIWSYVTDSEYKNGHPVLNLAKNPFPYTSMRLKDFAIMDEAFKLRYNIK